ncbi:hypothetical protein MMC13_005358 [Lambiella insularis]|nr:hypothetical protein [Lambiella insularis]
MAALVVEQSGTTPVIVNSLCPGFCKSELAREYDSWYELTAVSLLLGLFARTTEEGSRALVSGTVQGVEGHGNFWRNDKFNENPAILRSDKQLQKKAWDEIIEVLESQAPEIKEILHQ